VPPWWRWLSAALKSEQRKLLQVHLRHPAPGLLLCQLLLLLLLLLQAVACMLWATAVAQRLLMLPAALTVTQMPALTVTQAAAVATATVAAAAIAVAAAVVTAIVTAAAVVAVRPPHLCLRLQAAPASGSKRDSSSKGDSSSSSSSA
jgi:hypothetical protein